MLYTAEDRGRRPHSAVRERVITGKCGDTQSFRAPVVGRLTTRKNTDSIYGKEALLKVIYGASDVSGENFLDDGCVVGAVFVTDSGRAGAGLPFPSISVSDLPAECNGRIALLDPWAGRLFVSPDISTVNRYLPRLFQRQGEHTPTFLLRDGRRLSLSVIYESERELGEGDAIIPLKGTDETEEELYLRLSEIAERATGRRVTLSLTARRTSSAAVRALMRASVWGELSILLCGILTEGELTDFMREYCRAFCELETEGREFNGYLPRGVCVDSPYLLSVAHRLRGIDFFIFDAEGLVSLLCKGRKTPPEDVLFYALSAISATVRERRDIWHGVILGERTLTDSFCQGLEACGVERYAVAPSQVRRLCRLL